jgi:hypothetical protein
MPTNVNTPAKSATPAKRKPATKPKPESKAATPAAKQADKQAAREALATRIAAERVTAAKLFAAANSGAVSIPVKSFAAFKRTYKRDVTAHAIGRKPSPRQAAALAVAALSNGAKLTDGATFSRKFDRSGAIFAIENGALSDCIASGLCTYDAKTETITIANGAEIASQIGAITLPA